MGRIPPPPPPRVHRDKGRVTPPPVQSKLSQPVPKPRVAAPAPTPSPTKMRPLPTYRLTHTGRSYSIESNVTGSFQPVIVGLDEEGANSILDRMQHAKILGRKGRS